MEKNHDQKYYDKIHASGRWSGRHFHLMPAIELYTAKKYFLKKDRKRVLDIGCGNGNICSWFNAQKKSRVYGIDLSKSAIKQAKLMGNNNLLIGDCAALPFKEDAFDLICAFDVLEHIDDYKTFMSEMNKITKKDGVVIIKTRFNGIFATRNIKNRLNGIQIDSADIRNGHYHCFDKRLFKDFENLDFKIIEVHHLGQIFNPLIEALISKANTSTIQEARKEKVSIPVKVILSTLTFLLFLEYFLLTSFPSSEIIFVANKRG